MSRIWKIAGREYAAYVRTVGFWLSILLLPVGFSTLGIAPMIMRGSRFSRGRGPLRPASGARSGRGL